MFLTMPKLAAGLCVAAMLASAVAAHPAHAAASTPPLVLQEWLYPGPAGSVTCAAAAEYAGGRLQDGVLKPEYIDFNEQGDPYIDYASNPAYACNGYSAANVASVKAHSRWQYMTTSLADLTSEEHLTSTEAQRRKGISFLVSFVKKIGFTGIDVDFENYWTPGWAGTDEDNYYTFLTELATAAHAQDLKVQVDGPAGSGTPFDYGTVLGDGVDQVVMMTYDEEFNSPAESTCLPISPYSWIKTMIEQGLAQIPQAEQDRFVDGLPSYGYMATGRCQNITSNLTFRDMENAPGYSANPTVIASRRDPSSGEIRWSDDGTFYDYCDQTAMDAKLAVVESLGVHNISVWALGGSNPWFSQQALSGS
jgi:spore germination protein YaaH